MQVVCCTQCRPGVSSGASLEWEYFCITLSSTKWLSALPYDANKDVRSQWKTLCGNNIYKASARAVKATPCLLIPPHGQTQRPPCPVG